MEKQNSSLITKKSKRMPRLKTIETIRGISTFFMVFGHYYVWFINKEISLCQVIQFWIQNFSMNHGFPFFVILIGLTQSFAIYRRLEKGIPIKELSKYIFKRGLIIIAISLLMNLGSYFTLLSINPLLIFDWNVMGMIGLSYIVTAYIITLKLPKPAYGAIGFGFIILDYYLPFRVVMTLKLPKLFFGVFELPLIVVEGILPIRIGFHVMAYMLIGTLLGTYWIEAVKTNKIDQFQRYLLIIGVFLFVITLPFDLWLIFNFLDRLNPTYFDYPWIFNHWIYYLFSIGNFAILFSVLLFIQDIKKKKWRIFDPIMLIGNISLTLFAVHFLIAVYFFLPFNLYNYFYVFPYTAWALALFIFIYVIALTWKRFNYKYSLEWLLRG